MSSQQNRPLLHGKIALVTGANSSIGLAVVKRFLDEGANVVVTDLDKEPHKEIGNRVYISADLSDGNHVESLFRQVKEKVGRIDILVNIAGRDLTLLKKETSNTEFITNMMDVNVKSCFLCSREAIKIMKEQDDGGSIINMSSLTYRGSNLQPVYSAAKGAVATLTKSLAQSVGKFNIRVNAVAPALIEVDSHKALIGDDSYQQLLASVADRYPLNRIGQPEDVAGPITFLASDQSSFITNQVIEVSGGARL